MAKGGAFERNVRTLLDEYLRESKTDKLEEYLLNNSNLPGPRANLELLGSFLKVVGELGLEHEAQLWDLCVKLSRISGSLGDPNEFVAMCGTSALGSLGQNDRSYLRATSRLREISHDPRWRVREAVAIGIQNLIRVKGASVLKTIGTWVEDEDWLAMRALAAGVAEPALMKDGLVRESLQLHVKIISRILASRERKSEEFKVLKKALGFSLSVVVIGTPKEGFAYMRRLLDREDPDLNWIVKENLKKDRLVRNFPREVGELKSLFD